MKSAPTAIITLSVLLTGCSGFVPIQTFDKTGIDILWAAVTMPVVSAETARTMQSFGEVVGYSCKATGNEPNASEVGATDQARIVAAQRGATAITGLICQEDSVSLFTNCWHSWKCSAMALH